MYIRWGAVGSLDAQIPPGGALEEFRRVEFQPPWTPDCVELPSACRFLGGIRVAEDVIEGGKSRSVFGSEGRALGVVETVVSAQHPVISREIQSAPLFGGFGSSDEIFAPHLVGGWVAVVMSLRVQPFSRRRRRRWWDIVGCGGGDGVMWCTGDYGRVEVIAHSLWPLSLTL